MIKSDIENNSPLVSILMPVYNGVNYIAETIESVRNQSMTDFELIVVDDGSVDKTATTVKELADIDPRIKYHYQANAGVSSARNHALSLARGRYLTVIDADDLWPSDRLKIQCRLALESDNRIIIGGFQRFKEEVKGVKEWLSETLLPTVKNDIEYTRYLLSLESYQMAIFNSAFGKTEIFKSCDGWNENLKSAEDWDYWIRLSMVTRFHHADSIFLFYRKHQASSTRTSGRTIAVQSQLKIIDQVSLKLNLSVFEKRKYKAFRYQQFISDMIYEKQNSVATKYLILSVLHSNIFLEKSFYRLAKNLIKGSFRKNLIREYHESV